MSDRLDRSWALRRAVHAWIDAHADASMPDIKRAFGAVHPDTVRSVVKRLRLAGRVAVRRDGAVSRVRVAAPFDELPDAARARLAAVGRKTGLMLGEANRKRARLPDGTFAPVPAIVSPGRYVNRPGSKPPLRNQGGQGAGGVWFGCCSLEAVR